MEFSKVKNVIGLLILTISSLTFLSVFDLDRANFAVMIAYVLLIFAWMDFAKLVIYVFLAFGAIAGFFLGNLDALYYAIPVGITYLLFAYLMSTNREKMATLVFLLSIPLLLINSSFYPMASTVSWGLIGLMVGIIENAVIEEMAEGDVFIIALYFMALGPFAFIPLALQTFTGMAFFERDSHGGSIYPVGPAMFIVSVPIFILLNRSASLNTLPEWLFYGHYHGVTNPTLAVIGAFIGAFGIPYLLGEYSKSEPEAGLSLAGGTMGAIAGLIAGLIAISAVAMVGMYLDSLGHENLATVLALGALLAGFFAGGFAWAEFSKLHYEGKSSINGVLWFWGLALASIVLSLYLIPPAWSHFTGTRGLALFTGFLVLVLFHLSIEHSNEGYSILDRLWQFTLYVSAFLAGLWAGFGLLWILQ